MKTIRRMLACLLCLLFAFSACAGAESGRIGYQDAHRFTLEMGKTKCRNGAQVEVWRIDTVNDDVDAALNALAQSWADELSPTLKAPKDKASRLTVSIRASRTGLTWMSFMVQARTVYQEKTVDVRSAAFTYDMATGEEIRLTDVFPADSAAWDLLQQELRAAIEGYWPGVPADAQALEAACAVDAIQQMDFTLHGMSLVLHLHAGDFYPGREQLIEAPVYYPAIRPMMTEAARVQTDNATYYKAIALTYDDGPNGWITTRMLDMLLQTGERATFFLVGERMKQQAFIVQREHDEGHAIATHNFRHVYANETPIATLQSLQPKVDAVHVEVVGLPVRVARAPGGQWEGLAEANVGWPLIQWSVDAEDWKGEDGPNPVQTAANIFAGADDGGIILMHDMKVNSVEASRRFIQRLQEDGYILLTVEELFAREGVPLEPGKPYWRCSDGKTEK